MREINPKCNIDIHPFYFIASLVEQGKHTMEEITIHIDVKINPSLLNEIVQIKESKRNNEIIITTKTRSKERQELINRLDENSSFHYLLEAMEGNINQIKTEIFLEERKHVLGSSELHTRFFDLPEFLGLEQQRIMAYYFPWVNQIREDIDLITSCFRSAIGYPVNILESNPKCTEIQGTTVGNWVINHKDDIGGVTKRINPCVQIDIGPVAMDELNMFIPGSKKRLFLEEVLFPTFLPEGWNWKTVILVDEKYKKFKAENYNEMSFTGINTYTE